AQLAAFDLPSDLASELKVVALVVDRPGAVGLHVNAVIGSGDELVEGQRLRPWQNADVGHTDQRDAVPAFRAHGAVRPVLADAVRRLARRNISGEEALGDDRRALRLHAFVVVSKGAQARTVLLSRVGYHVHDVTAVTQRAQFLKRQK